LLSNNYELNRLPSSMTKLTSLLHLSLNCTKIQSDTLISVVCQLPSLQVLELDGTKQLETLPSQISQLTSLQHLSLSWNGIKSLPTQLGLFTQLHTLNLYWCDSLNNISTELEHLTNLIELRLFRTTQINRFPLKMKNWIKLEVLVLDSLNIETIPSEVWMMTKLREISFSDNKLSFIPSELYCLSNLTYLDLSSIKSHTSQIKSINSLNFNFSIYRQIDWQNSLMISYHFFIWVNYGFTITNWNSFHHNFFQILFVCISLEFNHFNFFNNTLLIDTTWKFESLLESNHNSPTQIGLLTLTFVINSGNKNMNRQWNVNFDKWDDKNIDTLHTISIFSIWVLFSITINFYWLLILSFNLHNIVCKFQSKNMD
jgi:hypothetical protein